MNLIFLILLGLLLASPAEAYKFASGSYTGSGSSRTIDISDTTSPSVTDFQPDVCIIKGNTTQRATIRISGMPDTVSQELANTGHQTTALLRFVSNGFELGTAATVNSNTVTYYYICLANDSSNDLASGSYTGNGANNRSITTSPAIQPELVVIARDNSISTTTTEPVWRGGSASHSGDSTSKFRATADVINRIDQLNSDGFRIDSDTDVNLNTATYFYFTLKTGVSTIATGSFTGNGSDNQAKTGLGFQPEFMWIKNNSASNHSQIRFKDNTSTNSCNSNNSAGCAVTDCLKSFDLDGFTVGTSGGCNANAVLLHWFAIKAPTAVAAVAVQTIIVE